MRQQHSPSAPVGWRHLFWLTLLVGASVAFSLGLACAIPFAAFAAAAALTLSRRDALILELENTTIDCSGLAARITAFRFVSIRR
jgi:hypothetical protein